MLISNTKGYIVKTLTNTMKLALILVVLAVLLLGWSTVWSHVKAVQVESAERISAVASDSHEANRIRVLLRASDEKILVHQDKLADVEHRRARIGSEMVALRGRIANQREILARARTLLSDPGRQTMDGRPGDDRLHRVALCHATPACLGRVGHRRRAAAGAAPSTGRRWFARIPACAGHGLPGQ